MSNKSPMTIGERLSPILASVEQVLWEHEGEDGSKPEFTQEGFRAAVKIFMSVMMDRMYSLQRYEDMDMEEMADMAETLGKEIRKLVKIYCDTDTYELYNETDTN